MNVYELANHLRTAFGLNALGFQSFPDRPSEEWEVAVFVSQEHGRLIDLDALLEGKIKPTGAISCLVRHEVGAEVQVYELDQPTSALVDRLFKASTSYGEMGGTLIQ